MKSKLFSIIILVFSLFAFSNNLKSASDSLYNTQRKIKQYSIEQFYKNQTISGFTFSNDETKLLVTSNLSGIFNLYEINLADGAMVPITASVRESLYGIDYVPNTKKIIYSSDKGGNEIDHIYLLNVEGTSVDLTPDEKAIADFKNWSADKKSMYYSSNKRNPEFFDLYKMDINTWQAGMVYQNDERYDIWMITEDANMLALCRSISVDDTKLYLKDRSKNLITEISDSLETGVYIPSHFSKDGKTFFI